MFGDRGSGHRGTAVHMRWQCRAVPPWPPWPRGPVVAVAPWSPWPRGRRGPVVAVVAVEMVQLRQARRGAHQYTGLAASRVTRSSGPSARSSREIGEVRRVVARISPSKALNMRYQVASKSSGVVAEPRLSCTRNNIRLTTVYYTASAERLHALCAHSSSRRKNNAKTQKLYLRHGRGAGARLTGRSRRQ